jgi:hypothetical protein
MAEQASRPSETPLPDDPDRKCAYCKNGTLELVEEWPHPLFGVLGVTSQKLKCDAAECGRFTYSP